VGASVDPRERVVAALFHAPGLRLFYGRRLTSAQFRANLFALAITAVAMVAGGLVSTAWWWGAFGAWAVGHAVWGLVLAMSLGASSG